VADIVKGAHDAVLSAHCQRPFPDDIHGQVIAGIRHVADMADDLPVVAEKMLFFEVEKSCVVIAPARQASAVPIVRCSQIAPVQIHDGVSEAVASSIAKPNSSRPIVSSCS
jgi:hypothetical protein